MLSSNTGRKSNSCTTILVTARYWLTHRSLCNLLITKQKYERETQS
jgi:hypothetical protein